MNIITDNIKELSDEAVRSSRILLGFGVDHIIEDSYIIIATFSNKDGRQRYFASGPDIPYVLNMVATYKKLSDFNGTVYKVRNQKCVPIAYNNDKNVKYWI